MLDSDPRVSCISWTLATVPPRGLATKCYMYKTEPHYKNSVKNFYFLLRVVPINILSRDRGSRTVFLCQMWQGRCGHRRPSGQKITIINKKKIVWQSYLGYSLFFENEKYIYIFLQMTWNKHYFKHLQLFLIALFIAEAYDYFYNKLQFKAIVL